MDIQCKRHDPYDLDPIWHHFERYATKRDQNGAQLTHRFKGNAQSHLIGVVGEWVFGKSIGVKPRFKVPGGDEGPDDGQDFYLTDVKATTYYSGPRLILMPSELRKVNVQFFALVAVDLRKRRARYCGWESMDDMRWRSNQAAWTADFGYGPRVCVDASMLRDGVPPIFAWGDQLGLERSNL